MEYISDIENKVLELEGKLLLAEEKLAQFDVYWEEDTRGYKFIPQPDDQIGRRI